MSTFRVLMLMTVVAGMVSVVTGCATMVNQRQMTLDEIVSMSQAGVSDSVIERQITATHSEFELTAADISRLKSAGVSDNVIESLIRSGETPQYNNYYPYSYWYDWGYPYYYPRSYYRRGDLLGRFYYYGPSYPYGIPDYGDYQMWQDNMEGQYDDQRQGESGDRDMPRRDMSGGRDSQ